MEIHEAYEKDALLEYITNQLANCSSTVSICTFLDTVLKELIEERLILTGARIVSRAAVLHVTKTLKERFRDLDILLSVIDRYEMFLLDSTDSSQAMVYFAAYEAYDSTITATRNAVFTTDISTADCISRCEISATTFRSALKDALPFDSTYTTKANQCIHARMAEINTILSKRSPPTTSTPSTNALRKRKAPVQMTNEPVQTTTERMEEQEKQRRSSRHSKESVRMLKEASHKRRRTRPVQRTQALSEEPVRDLKMEDSVKCSRLKNVKEIEAENVRKRTEERVKKLRKI